MKPSSLTDLQREKIKLLLAGHVPQPSKKSKRSENQIALEIAQKYNN